MDIYQSAKFIFDRMLDHTTKSSFFVFLPINLSPDYLNCWTLNWNFERTKKIKSFIHHVGGYHTYHRSSCIGPQLLPFCISPFSMPSYNIWNFFHPCKVLGIHIWSQIRFQRTHTHKRKHVHLVQHKWNLYERIWS